MPVASIFITKNNLRQDFDTPEDAELVESVRRSGVIERLIVRDNSKWEGATGQSVGYDLIAGERRLRAAKKAGLTVVPCEVYDVDDEAAAELMLLENLQRKDLHELEYADGFLVMIKKRGYTVETLSAKLSKGKTFIRDLLRLGGEGLPEKARKAFRAGTINKSIAVLIATVPGEKQREKYSARVLRGNDGEPMTFRRAKELKEDKFMKDLKGAPFPLDQQLDPEWPHSCLTCRHYNGNTEETRQGKRPNICLNPPHYQVMVQGWQEKLRAQMEEKGEEEVLSEAETKGLFGVDWKGDIRLQGDKYVDVGHTFVDSGDGYRSKPWAPVIKKGEVKTVVAIDPDGRLHKLALKTEAEAAARAQGFNKRSLSENRSPAEMRLQAEKRLRNAVKRAVAAEVFARLERTATRGKVLFPRSRMLAVLQATIRDTGDKVQQFVCRQLKLEPAKTNWGGKDWKTPLLRLAEQGPETGSAVRRVRFHWKLLVQVLVIEQIAGYALDEWGRRSPDNHDLSICFAFGVDIRNIATAKLREATAVAKKKKIKKPVALKAKAARA